MADDLQTEVIKAFHRKNFTTPVIGITGGKGGVGKTTVAVNIACALAEKGMRVALVDADVDGPDAAILLSVELANPVQVDINVPQINAESCNSCGDCVRACRLNALFLPRNSHPLLLGDCNGCEACFLVCRVDAISRGRKSVGMTYLSWTDGLSLYTGALIPGFEESSVVVQAVRERAFADAEQFDLILIDTSPGAHCNVINALRGVDAVMVIAEPTPFGIHDLELILKLLDLLELDGNVVLNRADLPGDRKKIREITLQHNRTLRWEIGMDDLLIKSYAAGIPVVREYPLAPSSKIFMRIAENIALTYGI